MTDVCAVDLSQQAPTREATSVRDKVRDLGRTITVYLAVAALSGVSYAVGASAWNGSSVVRWWLAAVLPIGLFLLFRTAQTLVARSGAKEKQLELFH